MGTISKEAGSDAPSDGYVVPDVELSNNTSVQCPPHTTERKLVSRIDLRVIPVLCVLYLLAFLDRVNISQANVFGLSKDLHIDTGTKYNNALVIFFVPYILFEIPSNVILKKLKPHVWLSGCMFGFGLVTMLQGFVTNYSGLLATRFFLGVFETGMFPGCFYLIGMWYSRKEAQRRYSFFFGSTTLAGAFGGLLATAIGKMDYVRGYRAWRWIFILEGLLTCIISFAFYFCIPDFPEDAKWLTPEERAFCTARLQAEQGSSGAERPTKFKDVIRTLKDPIIAIGGFMYFGLIVPAYGYAYFSPSIIRSYGYSPIATQLYSVPPWAAAFVFAMIIAYASDKTRHRFAFTLIPICVAIAGFAILITVHDNHKLQYGALFLVAMGAYSAMPVIVCYFNQNLGSHARRSTGSAFQIGFGNIGGVIAVYAFLSKDAPKYITGYSICIAFVILSALSCTLYLFVITKRNRERNGATFEGLTDEQKAEMGDLSPDYRYMI